MHSDNDMKRNGEHGTLVCVITLLDITTGHIIQFTKLYLSLGDGGGLRLK